MNHTRGLIVYTIGVIVLLGGLVGVALFVDSRPEPPEPIIKEVEKIVEVLVVPEPVPIVCYYGARGQGVIIIPFSGDIGPPPTGWIGGYVCSDTMSFRSDIPRGGAILNVEAHLGATRGNNGN